MKKAILSKKNSNRLLIDNLEQCPIELLEYATRLIEKEKERRWKELMKQMPKTEGYHET